MIRRILLFGDTFGIPLSLKVISNELLCGLVVAQIRPHQHDEIRQLAADRSLPFLIQPRAKSPDYPAFLKQVIDLAPELILVNSYSMLVPAEILAVPPLGALNIHIALLPQYRGCNPIQWALLNNETETGVTMHYMTAAFDAGDIVAQRRVPIHFDDAWPDIQARLGSATELMLAEELPRLLAGTNSRTPQDETQAIYHPRRHPEDGLIDWRQSVLSIYNLIRALIKPHPGAFYFRESDKIVLDEYLSIAEVTALKYGPGAGAQSLSFSRVTLLPAAGSRSNTLIIFIVSLDGTSEHGGKCHLLEIDHARGSALLELGLVETITGDDRLTLEVLTLVLEFAFKDLELRRVLAHVPLANQREIECYEKAGFAKLKGGTTLSDSAGRAQLALEIFREKLCLTDA